MRVQPAGESRMNSAVNTGACRVHDYKSRAAKASSLCRIREREVKRPHRRVHSTCALGERGEIVEMPLGITGNTEE